MFASRKQLHVLRRELQHTRLIVDGLRRDMNRAQKQLRDLNGWGDDFVKTHEVAETETRAFVRETWPPDGSPDAPFPAELDAVITSPEDESPISWIRRRFG